MAILQGLWAAKKLMPRPFWEESEVFSVRFSSFARCPTGHPAAMKTEVQVIWHVFYCKCFSAPSGLQGLQERLWSTSKGSATLGPFEGRAPAHWANRLRKSGSNEVLQQNEGLDGLLLFMALHCITLAHHLVTKTRPDESSAMQR